MKLKLSKWLSVILAGLLQAMPLLRSVLPTAQEALASPTGSLILKWVAGGTALFGFHAISSASSISISPPTATIGTPYAGTLMYSGSHSGSVSAMVVSNHCMGSLVIAPGLTLTYTSGHTASLSGTPTGPAGSFPLTLTVYDIACNSGLNDTRSFTFTVQTQAVVNVGPSFVAVPQSVTAQIGSDVTLSGGATGLPAPQYFWKYNLATIPGATNNTFTVPAAQLTNAGVYQMVASNSVNVANASCYLSMVITPGSNILGCHFTNYPLAGLQLTMSSFITNSAAGTYTYQWQRNHFPISGETNSAHVVSAATAVPLNSGIFTIQFNSSVGSSNVVVNQAYDSYWVFGYAPAITNQPSPVSVGPGSNATFNVTLAGSSSPSVLLYQNQSNLMGEVDLPLYTNITATTTTNISITVSNVAASNAGTYTFVVTNFWGSITSTPVALTVSSPLGVSNPQSQTNYAGKNISFTVTGTNVVGYQWRIGTSNLSNGGIFSGANTNTFNITPAAVSDSGSYSVVVSNGSGSVTSSAAVLSILPVPSFHLSLATSNSAFSASGGVPGSSYVLDSSTNLGNPAGWVPIATNTVPQNGSISITDTNGATNTSKYYRIQFP